MLPWNLSASVKRPFTASAGEAVSQMTNWHDVLLEVTTTLKCIRISETHMSEDVRNPNNTNW